MKLKHIHTRVVVDVAEAKVSRLGREWAPIDDVPAPPATDDATTEDASAAEGQDASDETVSTPIDDVPAPPAKRGPGRPKKTASN